MDGGRSRAMDLLSQESLRDGTWGTPGDREFVEKLATLVATRAGFQVCVLEVVRGDSTVECVAVHGAPSDEDHRVGHVRPLTPVETVAPSPDSHGDLTFLAGAGGRARHACRPGSGARVPGPRPDEDAEVWLPDDRLVAHLRDDQQELRALVLLDQPVDGHRRRAADLRTLSDDLELAFRALVTAVDRELLTQQVRLTHAVRRVLRSASNDTDECDLIDLVRWQMREGFRADVLYVHVFDVDEPTATDEPSVSAALFRALLEASRRAWTNDEVIIIEPGHIWGDEALRRDHAVEIEQQLVERRAKTMVLVPIGDNAIQLGVLRIERSSDRPRWTASESRAALDVCRDLGHAILNARAIEREQSLNVELTRRDVHRTELIATLSHELNNPVGVILGHLEILVARTDLDPEVHRSLAAIGRGAERIASLSEDLLVLRVLEDPNHRVDRTPVDLVEVVVQVVDLVQVVAAQSGVALEVDTPERGITVLGSRAELTQAVTNVVSNAIKYTDAGGQVCLRVERDATHVTLTCTDNGIGISEADLAQLFREFFRSTNTDALQRPGHGLGLTILQRIVERHEGTVEVDSKRGQGTTFRITLPAVD